MFVKALRVLLFVSVIGLTISGALFAQSNTLQYNTSTTGSISANEPVILYNFTGAAGDLIMVRVLSLTGGFTPTVTLLNASQLPLSSVDSSGFISRRLQDDGRVSILVGSADDQAGDFVLRLDGAPPPEDAITLTNFPATLTVEDTEKHYFFDVESATSLTLTALSDELRYHAILYDGDGALIAALHNTALSNRLNVLPMEGTYQLTVYAAPEGSGEVQVALGAGQTSSVIAPVRTPEAGTGACTVASASGVNVRAGDSTDFAVLGTLGANQSRGVTGINANRTWYQIEFNGQSGWVAASVVTTGGDCANVSVVQSPAPPQQTGATAAPTLAAGVTATATTANGQPTQEQPTQAQPTDAPTLAQPTETATQPAQEAPPDADPHIANADRDNGGSFSESISYPGGDTSDRVEVRVNLAQSGTDSARNVNVQLSCSGTGTENVVFTRTSPNAQQFRCGDTISFRYAFPDSTQMYYVFIPSGGTSYVNYTLNITTSP